MALKLAAIIATLVGMFAYAQSNSVSGPTRPMNDGFVRRMQAIGYVLVRVTKEPQNLTVETFELNLPSRLHYHTVTWIDLIIRDDKVVNFAHGASAVDVADQDQGTLKSAQ